MRAWRFVGDGLPLAETQLPRPEPGPGEVVVEVRAAGLCHSDLHVLDGDFGFTPPLTLGHEGAGVVAAIGVGIDDLAIGDRVAVFGADECGTCPPCLANQPNLCPDRRHVGLDIDGCFAEFVLATRAAVVPLPDGVTFADGAACCDAVLTSFHALRTIGGVRDGERVAIFGIGGLGHNAVQIAVDAGAEVVAIDPDEDKRRLASVAGAAEVLPDGTSLHHAVDVAADFVGNEQTLAEAQQAVRIGGRVVVVGLQAPKATLVSLRLAAHETALLGAYWGTRAEFNECLALVAADRIRPLIETHALHTINDQVERLRQGRVAGRVILEP